MPLAMADPENYRCRLNFSGRYFTDTNINKRAAFGDIPCFLQRIPTDKKWVDNREVTDFLLVLYIFSN